MIRIGRRVNGVDPTYAGFKKILCLTPSTPYGSLGPYALFDENDINMENAWQFSKIYEEVPQSLQRYSRWDDTIIWSWPSEKHVENDELLREYKIWRESGLYNQYPVRYPVGIKHTKSCIGSLIRNVLLTTV